MAFANDFVPNTNQRTYESERLLVWALNEVQNQIRKHFFN